MQKPQKNQEEGKAVVGNRVLSKVGFPGRGRVLPTTILHCYGQIANAILYINIRLIGAGFRLWKIGLQFHNLIIIKPERCQFYGQENDNFLCSDWRRHKISDRDWA